MKHSMVPPLLPKSNGPHLRSVFADDAADDAYDDADDDAVNQNSNHGYHLPNNN